ncbi:MAG: DUF1080 domain-containing protein [Bacteroidales bacterium]|nr:DUF1080 domain-containing protein [Bacteroidales bacterium]
MAGRVVALVLGLVLIGCRGGQKELAGKGIVTELSVDSTLIFNGKDLDGWEITNFGPQGPVYISGDAIILGMGEGCTGVTYRKDFPEMNYKVTLEAKKVDGNDFFCGITFPVGDSPCTFIAGGWGGTTVGLSSINGADASENETTTLRKFEKDVWYKICLIVKPDTIRALIDDKVVVNLAIGDKKLSIRPEVELSRPFGITSWNTTAALRNIRVLEIEEE